MKEYPLLRQFFDVALEYYLIPDLERLRKEIRPRGPRRDQGGCTIATAMLAFSLVDLIGFLIRPDLPPRKKRDTQGNMTYGFSAEAGLFPPSYAPCTRILLRIFRHGIAHQVFPKACGISKPHPPVNALLFTIGPSGPPTPNVDVFVDDLLSALPRLRQRVSGDMHLAARVEERIAHLRAEDAAELSEFIAMADGRIGAGFPETRVTTTTTTTTTGG